MTDDYINRRIPSSPEGGEMARAIRDHDWASTPLGPMSGWPQELRTLVQIMTGSAHPMFVAWGRNDLTVIYNDGLIPILGQKHPNALGKNHLDVWNEVREVLIPLFEQVWSGQSVHIENFVVHTVRNGFPEEALFTFSFNPTNGPSGEVEGIFCAIVETSGQVNAERRLREHLAIQELTWVRSPDLLTVMDIPSGTYKRVNPAWTRVLGWTKEELEGRRYDAFVHPEDVEMSATELAATAEGSLIFNFTNRYRTKDGGWRWLAWAAVPDGDKLYGNGRDVTVEKERELALAQAEEALRQSQKMEAVGQLTGGIAHDFNNLLAGMLGNLELLQMRVARGRVDDLDRFINAAQGAGRRAASLTQRLLAFSRRQTLDPRPTDVNRLIAELQELLHRTVGATVEIEVVQAAGLWTTQIDGQQLENAIINLCVNGRDAMPDGGRLTIETANKWIDDRTSRERDLPPGQYVSVCVTDSGTGMTAETIQRAFEPFYTTKPIGQGTGLGLSMIYGFARQSGGQVRIYSEVGQGTTVCIYLPRFHGDADVGADDISSAIVDSAKGQTVLVVDDEATIRHVIDEVLDDLGYTVIGAADGAAAIKVLQSGAKIELLITDVGLPNGMNGRQVADQARHMRPGLKVLFITGFAENAAVGNGHLEPGMELLTKPFTLEALTSKVAEMVKRPAR